MYFHADSDSYLSIARTHLRKKLQAKVQNVGNCGAGAVLHLLNRGHLLDFCAQNDGEVGGVGGRPLLDGREARGKRLARALLVDGVSVEHPCGTPTPVWNTCELTPQLAPNSSGFVQSDILVHRQQVSHLDQGTVASMYSI